ncbi:hypothetical protein ACJX0J_008937, partial [Zea mays]
IHPFVLNCVSDMFYMSTWRRMFLVEYVKDTFELPVGILDMKDLFAGLLSNIEGQISDTVVFFIHALQLFIIPNLFSLVHAIHWHVLSNNALICHISQ